MASIHQEIDIAQSKDRVWDAIRDVGSIHRRLVPGFVVDCRLDGDSRFVTFANGMTVRELIVDIDDRTCRHSWSAVGGSLTHHNASLQAFALADGACRVVWIADLLPHTAAEAVAGMIRQGLETMKRTLEDPSAARMDAIATHTAKAKGVLKA